MRFCTTVYVVLFHPVGMGAANRINPLLPELDQSRAVLAVETEGRGESKLHGTNSRHGLTFISHAGEEKRFVHHLLTEIGGEGKVAAFFDDDMALGTLSEDEMFSQAAGAEQAIVVLSRAFVTKAWPMKELNIFLKNGIDIIPVYHSITPDELWDIMGIYDRQVLQYDALTGVYGLAL